MELPRPPASPAPHRLTASNVARYFKHSCDRLFRWEAEARRDSKRQPNEPTVPTKPRSNARPGIDLLMKGGDTFEYACVEALLADPEVGEVYVEGGALPPHDPAHGRGAQGALGPARDARRPPRAPGPAALHRAAGDPL